jgi:hypothetical protein
VQITSTVPVRTNIYTCSACTIVRLNCVLLLFCSLQITLTVPVRTSFYMQHMHPLMLWSDCVAPVLLPLQITSTVPVRTSFYTYSVDWERIGFETLLYLCMIFVLASQVRYIYCTNIYRTGIVLVHDLRARITGAALVY